MTASDTAYASLAARVAALEQGVSANSEALSPNYLTLDPATGKIGALFTGGIQIPEGTGIPFAPGSGIGWIDALNNLIETIYAYGPGPNHILSITNTPDAQDTCNVTLEAEESGGVGTAAVGAGATSALQSGVVRIIGSDNSSSFLQMGAPFAYSFCGVYPVTWNGSGQTSLPVTVTLPNATAQAYAAGASNGLSTILDPVIVDWNNNGDGTGELRGVTLNITPPNGSTADLFVVVFGI